ncbi:MAG TPA: cytochrome c [Bryobacteraceae bacterium]|jgi:mono/diheme cytochrome c family protein|nr:cytochrome c [Bryobacteraceae bacterium]
MSKPAIVAAAGVIALFGFCSIIAGQNKQTKQSGDTVKLIDSIQGPNLYKAYCAVCHGPNAKGDGPMATFLKTAPSDLTRISAKNGGMFPLAKVRRIISGEESLPGGHGTRDMPLWGPIFSQVASDQDLGRVRIDNLARYLESLQGK